MRGRIVLELCLFLLGVIVGARLRASRASRRKERAWAELQRAILEVRETSRALVRAARTAGLAVETTQVREDRDQRGGQ